MATKLPQEKPFTGIDMFRALWYFLREHKVKALIWQILLTLIYLFETFVPPYALAKLAQYLINVKSGDNTQIFYILAIALGLSLGLAGVGRNYFRLKMRLISIDMSYNARVEGFERLMNFSYAWHQEENSGVRVQRISTGVSDLGKLWRTLYLTGINLVASLIGTFALFSLVNWSVGLFFAIYLVVTLLIEWYFNHKIFQVSDRENAAREKTSGTYFESASNALTVKALGAQKGIKQSVIRSEQGAKERATQSSAMKSMKYRIYQVVGGVGAAIFLVMVGSHILNGSLEAPFFLAYYMYFNRMRIDTVDFGDLLTDLAELRSGIGRMMPIYWTSQNADGTKPFPEKWKKLNLDKVGFAYPGASSLALTNINLKIERGQKIGIAGRSGEGKSTLAKLLLSVYSPDTGSIKIGDTNLQEIRSEELVHHISAVLQETELFSLSLKENITLFRTDESERLATAIKVARLDDLIAELPEGLETQIGEKGYKLSGGQRQRVGIARAVYATSDIIVMDEATSSLDSVTEAEVQKGIEQELGERTLIMIAHRLSTLQQVDHIYFVEAGMIAESGTFDELIAKPDGLFRQQFELQNRKSD